MIDYAKTKIGDILKVVAPGAPGWAEIGDLVRVVAAAKNSVTVENRHGIAADFMYNCGAERLEETEWKGDFPATEKQAANEYGPCGTVNDPPGFGPIQWPTI